MRSGKGADILNIAASGSGSSPSPTTSGRSTRSSAKDKVEGWDGWEQIPDSVQLNSMVNDKRYGVPHGTDGRVIYYNKSLFTRAGLPAGWQPTSWDEILTAARTLKSKLPGVTQIQLNAGTAIGEATTMQDPTAILSSHLPPAVGHTAEFLDMLTEAPHADPFVGLDQQALEELLASFEPALAAGCSQGGTCTVAISQGRSGRVSRPALTCSVSPGQPSR